MFCIVVTISWVISLNDFEVEIIYFKRVKSTEKVKMAEKPKRPLSSYMLWLGDNREQIKRENPGIKVTEVAKRGGELWRALEDKSKWEAKAVEAKDKYIILVKEYEANGGGKSMV